MGGTGSWNRPIGMLGLRLVIGLLSAQIAMHKIFLDGLESQMRWFQDLAVYFPDWFLRATNIYCAVVELVAGVMLILGLKRDWALYAILSVLVIVTFGHGMERAVWDIQQMVARLAMVVTLLLLPADWDVLRLDWLMRKKS
ncbi:MAG: DoxX family protein [Hyphomonadaceae bacterium]|nr:DoxX family protein [Hyphomonadaceae bacterium]